MILSNISKKIDQFKSRELVPLQCKNCKKLFYRTKNKIQSVLKGNSTFSLDYCSCKCNINSHRTKTNIICIQCSKSFMGYPYRKFCSHSCSGTYNNGHKIKGNCRSKLELWIESQLKQKYPQLEIHYNKTNTINAELDIYIPSLKLAFELNGIFHYEPIFSEEKLQKTQNNDQRKFQACLEKGVELCVIDASSQKYFKEKTSQKYLDIITNLLEQKVGGK